MIEFNWYPFSALNGEQVYAMLSLRSRVFVVEQQCPYQDADGQDTNTVHLFGMEEGQLVAYLRLFPPTDSKPEVVFGRVVTAPEVRQKGYGKQLLQEMLSYCDWHFPDTTIQCSAQHYLLKFYQGFGFKEYGDIYEEDGIPHIAMKRTSAGDAIMARDINNAKRIKHDDAWK